ncbi:hypothetical protein EGW08_001719 [Elysia chlorotica]|uniref:Uncharacterized protein n=1 Tax=Elysia chlorotica TaxID=188477 RepID=A0A3S0ZZH7_ELYCH|nr:hypothetical protein EGW08_001719 [Elysia chlorotica]
MEGSVHVGFDCGKKKYTEKDFYVKVVNDLCRMYVNKEKGHGHIWMECPKNWDEGKLGPWRSPTGKSKDNLPSLKKKCDFLLENLPLEKKEKVDNIKYLVDLVNKDKEQTHTIVTMMLFHTELCKAKENLEVQTVNIKEMSSCFLVQEVSHLLNNIKKMITESVNRKRTISDKTTSVKSTVKKKKYDPSVISNQTCFTSGTTSLNFKPIQPKPSALPSAVLYVPASPSIVTHSDKSSTTFNHFTKENHALTQQAPCHFEVEQTHPPIAESLSPVWLLDRAQKAQGKGSISSIAINSHSQSSPAFSESDAETQNFQIQSVCTDSGVSLPESDEYSQNSNTLSLDNGFELDIFLQNSFDELIKPSLESTFDLLKHIDGEYKHNF